VGHRLASSPGAPRSFPGFVSTPSFSLWGCARDSRKSACPAFRRVESSDGTVVHCAAIAVAVAGALLGGIQGLECGNTLVRQLSALPEVRGVPSHEILNTECVLRTDSSTSRWTFVRHRLPGSSGTRSNLVGLTESLAMSQVLSVFLRQ